MKFVLFLTLFSSFNLFAATLTIRSPHEHQNVDQAPIERTTTAYGRFLIRSFHPKEGCFISKETAEQSGYSFGELQTLASMGDVEIICRTDGKNEWGDYIPTSIEVVTNY
ncbi:hypothetical protein N9N67_02275 [Bacteriovoracaceae bacterium]|nr:hypothetical protein [Bacteriovoracaceae bacterium]